MRMSWKLACVGGLGVILLRSMLAEESRREKPEDSQAPNVEWHRGHGTGNEEHVHEGMQTSDGGYIAIGHTWEGRTEYTDFLVIKTDASGRKQWHQVIETRSQYDVGICVHQVSDGYILGGGLHSFGSQQRALVKLSSDGDIVWRKTYPDRRQGAIRGIDITRDGEIVATGYVNSAQRGFVFIVDDGEGFILKTDADGNRLWDRRLSAPQGAKVREEEGGGFAVASTKWVTVLGTDYQNVALMKLNSEGRELWTRTYGGPNRDQCFDFDLTSDGGYVFAGHTRGHGVSNWDYLLLKVDRNGKKEWHKTFGQPRRYDAKYIHDECYAVRKTPDGGYIMAGGSGDEDDSYCGRGHPTGTSNEWKIYLVRTDAHGNLLWEGIYGDPDRGNNAAEYIGLTGDGGFIVFVDTDSQIPPAPNNFGFMKLR